MLQDSDIRRSLDAYIRRRIQEIPTEIKHTFPSVIQIWKCDNETDFLYGYFIGKIEEGALHYLLKATRASVGDAIDEFEIRNMIEIHREEIRSKIKETQAT